MSGTLDTTCDTERLGEMPTLKERVRFAYEAHGRFRIAMPAFDLATVAFFLVTTFLPYEEWILWADYAIGSILLLDFAARLWTARNRGRFIFSIWTLIDVVVIISMLAPMFIANYAFLRVLRAMRLLRSYAVLRDLKLRSSWFSERGEMLTAAVNLMVFVVSAFVYVDQVGQNERIAVIACMGFSVRSSRSSPSRSFVLACLGHGAVRWPGQGRARSAPSAPSGAARP